MSFPECYEDFIAKAHYARFLDEEERRENWDEIVERYLNFIFDHINENNNPGWEGAEEGQLYNELYRAIYNKEVFPSMRGLWSAGPALKRDHVALYNPVAGDTLVLTYEKGLTPISELEGEDFTVLNVRGDWASATFRGYGEQETVEVNLRLNSNTKKTVRATLNHRWVLQDGRVVSTKDLKRGDRISFVAPRRPSMDNLDYDLGIIHGLVYGDGVATYSQERVNGYLLRICKDVEDILPYLDKYPVAYPPSMGGDPVVMIYDPFAKTHSLKSLPPSEETDEYLLGFMRGWLAADGSVTATSQVSLAAGEEEIEWINNVASRIGFVIQNTYCYPNKTNFGYRKKNLFCISFSRSCMVPEDFIIERKRDNFKSLESHYVFCDFGDRYMKNVYCAEVPDTNTFVLDQGLVTGNCAYVPIDSINSFEEMIYMLACGTGVGFSVEEQYISKLFKVPRHFNNSGVVSAHIVVEDSKYGWAQSYGEFLYYLYRGAIPSWDIGYLRPRGARLKVFGGRSSGPEALQELFEFTIKIFMGARGRKLSALECHDLACKVGEVILSGGVRRAALISLQDLNDDDLRYAKSGEWWKEHPHRALSNNSAVYDGIPSRDVFDKEWAALVNSGSGERGIFNKRAALNQVNKTKRRNNNYEFRVNPCQPSFATLLTPDGLRTFDDIDVGSEIWTETGFSTVSRKWSTGVKYVYRYRTSAGYFLGTENHRVLSKGEKFEVKDAEILDCLRGPLDFELGFTKEDLDPQDVMDGLMIGDGSIHLLSGEKTYLTVGYKDTDYYNDPVGYLVGEPHAVHKKNARKVQSTIAVEELPRTYERSIPDRFFYGEPRKVAGFLRGLFSANGSVIRSRVVLKATSFVVVSQVQEMLSSLGMKSYYTTNKEKAVKHSNGTYVGRKSYDLNITTDRNVFANLIGFIQEYKQQKLDGLVATVGASNKVAHHEVIEVEELGEYEVFDITVNNIPHTYWTSGVNVSNCSEILLRPNEFCNLSTVVVRPEDTADILDNKIRLATILGTFQSTFVDFKLLRSDWKRNAVEERLLGVSMTGMFGNELMSGKKGFFELRSTLRSLKEAAKYTNFYWADRLGINRSAAITAVKPEGTSSQLAGVSSGLHPWHSEYFIRTVRIDKKDPIADFLVAHGVPCEEDVMAPDHRYVFSFPVKSPDGAILRDNLSAIEHLNIWKVYQDEYCEHKPSATISVKAEEWREVGDWVYNNFEDISGISFLPYSDHTYAQAPYQEITREEYEELIDNFPCDVNFNSLKYYEKGDDTVGAKTLACSGDSCELVDVVK